MIVRRPSGCLTVPAVEGGATIGVGEPDRKTPARSARDTSSNRVCTCGAEETSVYRLSTVMCINCASLNCPRVIRSSNSGV